MPHAKRSGTKTGGFTLVELLVVIGIIALLIGILLPVASRARKSAQEIKSLSNLRQMLIGYTAYHSENRGHVLWGYTPPTVNGAAVVAYDPVSTRTITGQPAYRYPWRLLRYCSNVWPILHSHGTLPPLPRQGDTAATVAGKAYTLSLDPTYGLNTVFLGGDYRALYQGFDGSGRPNAGKFIVFKANEVRRPGGLIVFADCIASVDLSGTAGERVGYANLTPPHAAGAARWAVVNGEAAALTGEITGLPHGWYTKNVMTGFFDGHAEAMPPDRLLDMRLWANDATTPDYDFQ